MPATADFKADEGLIIMEIIVLKIEGFVFSILLYTSLAFYFNLYLLFYSVKAF